MSIPVVVVPWEIALEAIRAAYVAGYAEGESNQMMGVVPDPDDGVRADEILLDTLRRAGCLPEEHK